MTTRPLTRVRRSLATLGVLALVCGASDACSPAKSVFAARPFDVHVTVTSASPASSRDARFPITFDETHPQRIVVDVQVRDSNRQVLPTFTGHDAWVLLGLSAGNILHSAGPSGLADPNVQGSSVHLVNGEAKGIVLDVLGAYGDVVVTASAIGFVPGTLRDPAHPPQCADGLDNDGNGFIDYPLDPNCKFLTDDSEAPFDSAFGNSEPIFFNFPAISDVRAGSSTPFLSQQVEIPGDVRRMIVTRASATGMYVTDIDGPPGGSNSLFVFNFNTPSDVNICDRMTRLAGNMSEFFGFTELGTPAWTDQPWNSRKDSGPCLVPDFVEVTDAKSSDAVGMRTLQSALVRVQAPTIGTHFGSALAPAGVPADGASNCDLNGDGVVGFSNTKPGFRPDEKACNDACSADADCTEWNNFLKFSELKIHFGAANGLLFLDASAVPTFNARDPAILGHGKFLEIRGTLREFQGPSPAFILEPRCDDDVIRAGTDPTAFKTAQTACVHVRPGFDTTGLN